LESDLAELAEESTKGGLILVSGTIISAIISAIASIIIARILGPNDYGLYSLSLVIPQIFFLITDFGIKEGIIKFTIESRQKNQIGLEIKIIKFALLIRAIAAIICFIFLFFASDLITAFLLNRNNLGFYMRIASVSVIFQALYSTVTFAYIGLDKVTSSSVITQIQSISKAIISVLFLILGFGLVGAIYGYVFGFIFAGLIGTVSLLFHLKKIYYKPIKNADVKPYLKLLIKYGTPLYFSTMLLGLMPQIIDVILSFFSSNYDIGNFKVTANFIVLMTLVTKQITTSFLPAFTKLGQYNAEKSRNFFNLTLKFTTLLMIPITTLLIIFSKDLIQLIYGITYLDAGLYLSIYSLQFFFCAIGLLNLPSLFNGLGRTRETLKMNAVIFIIVILFALIITNFFGILGLIFSIIIGYGLGSFYGFFLAKRLIGVTINWKSTLKIFSSALLSAIGSIIILPDFSFIFFKLILGLLSYLFLYITLIPLTHTINKSELKSINNFIKRNKILFVFKPIMLYQQKILKIWKN